MIELYEFPLSGNCHKIRLLLSLLNLEYKSHMLNGAVREQKTPEFLVLNSFGQVPVLKDGNVVVRDSQAILVYLARAYASEHWFPVAAESSANIMQWLSTAANEVARGPNALRLHYKFGRVINMEDAIQTTNHLLHILNQQLLQQKLSQQQWLATQQISIADIAIYPYIALANEGNVDLGNYPAILQWLARIEALPAYVSMHGIRLQAAVN